MMVIQKKYKEAGKNIEQMSIIKGSGTTIVKIYYFIVPQDEKLRIQSELKAQLEIK
jgi:hypothetical protein